MSTSLNEEMSKILLSVHGGIVFCELRVVSCELVLLMFCELRVASCKFAFHHINSCYAFVLILDSSQSFL